MSVVVVMLVAGVELASAGALGWVESSGAWRKIILIVSIMMTTTKNTLTTCKTRCVSISAFDVC